MKYAWPAARRVFSQRPFGEKMSVHCVVDVDHVDAIFSVAHDPEPARASAFQDARNEMRIADAPD